MIIMKALQKANNFLSERMQLACDTIVDITETVTESFEPLKKHKPEVIVRFVTGQKNLFEKRRVVRDKLLSNGILS